jgi:hypothetical protein
LTDEAVAILALQSAAVFRLRGERHERTASVSRGEGTLTAIEADDRLVRRLLADDPVARLSSLHWKPDGLPSPGEPIVALALAQAGRLIGVAFYGSHRNGTEIDPARWHCCADSVKPLRQHTKPSRCAPRSPRCACRLPSYLCKSLHSKRR